MTAASGNTTVSRQYHAFAMLLRDYEWIHRILGIFGHVSFFVGSICFLWESWQLVGVWLFIIGAGGMMLDRICSLIVHYERLRQNNQPIL